jgi:hypothetical protein
MNFLVFAGWAVERFGRLAGEPLLALNLCLRIQSRPSRTFQQPGSNSAASEGATCPFNDTRVGESGLLRMAPHLPESQHVLIKDMSHSKQFKAKDIANDARCSTRAIYRIQKNLRCFGSTKAPSNSVGRPRSITPLILDALCKHLLEKP